MTYKWPPPKVLPRAITSSVARGARGTRAPPIALKNKQNSAFLVLLRPIFAPKMKTAPPPKEFGSRSCEGLAVIWTRIVEFFGSGAHPKSMKTFFFLLDITCFWPEKPFEFLISARKSLWISVKTFFGGVWRPPNFYWKIASIQFKTNENFGQVRLQLYQTSKKAPLLCEILATRLAITLKIFFPLMGGWFDKFLNIGRIFSKCITLAP